jgi:hypothetical protein
MIYSIRPGSVFLAEQLALGVKAGGKRTVRLSRHDTAKQLDWISAEHASNREKLDHVMRRSALIFDPPHRGIVAAGFVSERLADAIDLVVRLSLRES